MGRIRNTKSKGKNQHLKKTSNYAKKKADPWAWGIYHSTRSMPGHGKPVSRSTEYRHRKREERNHGTTLEEQFPEIARALRAAEASSSEVDSSSEGGKSQDMPPHDEPLGEESLFLPDPNEDDHTFSPLPNIENDNDSYAGDIDGGEAALSNESTRALSPVAQPRTLLRLPPQYDDHGDEDEESSDEEEGGIDKNPVVVDWNLAHGEEERQQEREAMDEDLRQAEDALALEIEVLSIQGPLSREQFDIVHALSYHITNGHSKQSWNGLQRLFPDRVTLPSFYLASKLLTKLSTLEEMEYDCCINSCCCFVAQFEDDDLCSYCDEARYDACGRPRNVFRYIPIIPRLKALFCNCAILELLKYRNTRRPFKGDLEDIFDGLHYLELLEKHVVVDGEELPHKFGEFETDLFLGLMLDGVALFKALGARRSKNNYTCWPLEVVVYNFSPTIRTQLKYVFSLGVIPGPREPKNMNSFLFPFYNECRSGSLGIPSLKLDTDSDILCQFMLYFYLLFAFGDIKALIKARCTKGPNSICPCHDCKIKGVRDPNNLRVTTHYVPHTRPGEAVSQINALLQDMKTHKWYLKVYHDIENAHTQKEKESLAKEAGVNGIPILGMLSSVDIAKSMPYGFMHQMFLNTFPNLCRHWQGDFKKIDATHERY